MKKIVLMVMVFMLLGAIAFAQDTTAPSAGASTATTQEGTTAVSTASETVALTGDLIDNMCATAQKAEDLANFIKTHTKECALIPACAASGYSIFADGKLSKFDAESNAKVEEFLKKADSKLKVVVVAKKTGDMLSLVSIENQKVEVKK